MELKLAKSTLSQANAKNKVNVAKISDKENSHKEMQKVCASFQKAGYNTYLNEVRYGLDEASYIYELHII